MSAAPGGQDGPDGGERISKNAALSLVAQLAGAAFTAALTLFLARELGTGGFGVLSLALGIAGLALLPSDFGISASSARFIAEQKGDRARAAAVLADSLRVKLLISTAVAALLCALAGPISDAYGIHALVWPLRGVAIALLGQSIMMMSAAFEAMARIRYSLITALVESSVETTASVALVLGGAGVTGAAFGRAIGFVAGGLMTIFALVRMLGPGVIPRTLRNGEHTRRIASYASVLLIVDGAYTLYNQIDVLIIGGFLGAGAVGLFSAPLRLMTFLGYPGNAMAAGVAPRLARSAHREPNVEAFGRALRVMLILQAAITAVVLGWSPLIVKVALGSGYGKSAAVLRALAPCIFLMGFGALVSVSANYLGEARRRVPVAIATVLINLVLDLLLVPSIGVIGGAIGTDASYALYVPAHLAICQRILHLDLRPAARTLARSLLAGAAMTGVLLLAGDSLDEPWQIPLGAIGGSAAFVLTIAMTGELTFTEMRALVSAAPMVGRFRRPAGDSR
ncbi:MAG TPA: oligosaccharide flippase family protein [Solirubrobacteraceae bacterium]|jgi:O-antigen/teichoic acid export membrane protein|nr:oligosaccharide flippase family protein [Solirubrobacteraceae bacterium]